MEDGESFAYPRYNGRDCGACWSKGYRVRVALGSALTLVPQLAYFSSAIPELIFGYTALLWVAEVPLLLSYNILFNISFLICAYWRTAAYRSFRRPRFLFRAFETFFAVETIINLRHYSNK